VIALAASCPKLSWLDIDCCFDITDAAMVALAASCPELSSFDLYHARRSVGLAT